jgi:hypothetical protein
MISRAIASALASAKTLWRSRKSRAKDIFEIIPWLWTWILVLTSDGTARRVPLRVG